MRSACYLLALTCCAGSIAATSTTMTTQSTVLSEADWLAKLTPTQRGFMQWTNSHFDRVMDRRDFSTWTPEARAKVEDEALQKIGGPQNQAYYEAINTLGALRSTKAVKPLLGVATDRIGRDCRDNWMATRALGLIGDPSVVPELIHLSYHTNLNTHLWAQIALVRLTGQNFEYDWQRWGAWWNAQGGKPAFKPEKIRWWDDPKFDEASTAEALAAADRKFMAERQH
jgi:hypothetical protein